MRNDIQMKCQRSGQLVFHKGKNVVGFMPHVMYEIDPRWV